LTNWDSKKNRFDEFYLAQHCCSDAQPAKEVVCVLSNGVISRDLQDSNVQCTCYLPLIWLCHILRLSGLVWW